MTDINSATGGQGPVEDDTLTMADRLLVALDLPSLDDALTLADNLAPAVKRYKVGLELFTAAGPAVLEQLAQRGSEVFVDLKLHDIPTTVRRAAAQMAHLGAFMFTVHAAGGPQMLAAACEGARQGPGPHPLVVAVTVLTSWSDQQWPATGISQSIADTVLQRAQQALTAGVDGVVCSPVDLPLLKSHFGEELLYVCPGITVEPAGSDRRDHGRSGTPEAAIADGANFLVVGRPITRAQQPRRAAQSILQRMSSRPNLTKEGEERI